MSEEQGQSDRPRSQVELGNETRPQTSDQAAARRAPNPWPRVLLGLVVFAVAGGFCATFLMRYLASRPVDLRAHTIALTDVAEQLLLNLGVPKEKIARAEPTAQEDQKASWYASYLAVDLPPGVPMANVAEPLKREMSAQSVSVAEARTGPLKQDLTFSFLDHPFLSVSLNEKPVTDLTAASTQVADEVSVILQTQGIPSEAIQRFGSEKKQDGEIVWTLTRIEAPLPASTSVEEFEAMIRNALTVPDTRVATQLGVQGTMGLTISHAGKPCVDLVFLRLEAPLPDDDASLMEWPSLRGNGEQGLPALEELPLDSSGLNDMDLGRKLTGIKFPGEGLPKVAIIVDDGGYGGIITDRILALNPALTIAVLPFTPVARDTARRAAERGFEVMMHMPMEPANMTGRLTTKMSREEIVGRTKAALDQIPQAVGANNHIGSVFTANEAAIKIFLEAIKERRLFFIDSRTTSQSRAYETARKMGIPTAMRDVFLDNEQRPDYIIGQFNHLIAVAKERGAAIGICHFRSATVPVLTEMLTQLDRNGIALVHVSELLRQPTVGSRSSISAVEQELDPTGSANDKGGARVGSRSSATTEKPQ